MKSFRTSNTPLDWGKIKGCKFLFPVYVYIKSNKNIPITLKQDYLSGGIIDNNGKSFIYLNTFFSAN